MKHENETQNLNDGLPTDEVFDLSETKIMEEEKKARLEAEFEEEAREEEEISGRTISPTGMVLKRFFRSKLSMTGLIILLVLFAFSFLGRSSSSCRSCGEKRNRTKAMR